MHWWWWRPPALVAPDVSWGISWGWISKEELNKHLRTSTFLELLMLTTPKLLFWWWNQPLDVADPDLGSEEGRGGDKLTNKQQQTLWNISWWLFFGNNFCHFCFPHCLNLVCLYKWTRKIVHSYVLDTLIGWFLSVSQQNPLRFSFLPFWISWSKSCGHTAWG